MAWFYFVDGAVRFPNADGPNIWRKTPIRSWRGKGKVTVALALEWASREALVDPSAPPKYRASYFFDALTEGPVVTFRGFIHRDEADSIEALIVEAAELGAKGKVLLEHAFDSDSGLRIEPANGKSSVRAGDVKMASHIIDAIEHESAARARKASKPTKTKSETKAKPKSKPKSKLSAKSKARPKPAATSKLGAKPKTKTKAKTKTKR